MRQLYRIKRYKHLKPQQNSYIFRTIKRKSPLQSGLFSHLVEMAGIEPASKNPFLQTSTCLVCHLKFPHTDAGKQASVFGISSSWQSRRKLLLTFTANRRPYSDRGTSEQDGSLIKLRKQLYFCQLFLKVRFSKRCRNAACLSQFRIPVETFTSPYITSYILYEYFAF